MFKAIDKMRKDEKGFTLVELLIVIAIIAILAAIAIPQFAQYRQKGAAASGAAGLTNCASELAATYADAGTPITRTCAAGGVLALDTTTGAITLTSGGTMTIKGLSVTCTITTGIVACT